MHLRARFIDKFPGMMERSLTFPKNIEFFAGSNQIPYEYRAPQTSLYVPPLEHLNGSIYVTRMKKDYKAISGPNGYPYLSDISNNWDKLDKDVVIIHSC